MKIYINKTMGQKQFTDFRTKLLLAAERLGVAIAYGEDMTGSSEVCIDDAIRLLEEAKYLKALVD